MRAVAYSLLALSSAFLPGCARWCHRHKMPELALPEEFSEGARSSTAQLSRWWTNFDDPVLNDLIQRAISQNYDLRAALEKIRETRYTYRIATADLLPEVDAFGLIVRNRFSKDVPLFSSATQNPSNFGAFGAATNWELDFAGRLRSARAAAYADYHAQIEAMRDVYIILLADVASYYIQARTLEKKILIAQEELQIDQALLTLSQDLYQSGLLDDSPDQQQIQQLQESASSVKDLEKMYAQTCYSLAALLGEMPERFVLDAGDGHIPRADGTLQVGLPSDLLRRRPDIREAEQKLVATDERLRESIAGFFPVFSLLGFVGTLSSYLCKWFDGNSLAWTIGPAFSWPVLTFGRITYDVKAKKSIQRQAVSAYCQTVINAFADVENALVDYYTQEKRCLIYEKKLEAAVQAAFLFKTRFDAGLADRLQYLLAEKSRLAVASELADRERELSSALIRIYKSLGGGWNNATDCS